MYVLNSLYIFSAADSENPKLFTNASIDFDKYSSSLLYCVLIFLMREPYIDFSLTETLLRISKNLGEI